MFKVNNKNIGCMNLKICFKLSKRHYSNVNRPRSGAFDSNFKHVEHMFNMLSAGFLGYTEKM